MWTTTKSTVKGVLTYGGPVLYSRAQPPFFFFDLAVSAARVAVSKTALTLSLVLAEHSKWSCALILIPVSEPSFSVNGFCEDLPSSAMTWLSRGVEAYQRQHQLFCVATTRGSVPRPA